MQVVNLLSAPEVVTHDRMMSNTQDLFWNRPMMKLYCAFMLKKTNTVDLLQDKYCYNFKSKSQTDSD